MYVPPADPSAPRLLATIRVPGEARGPLATAWVPHTRACPDADDAVLLVDHDTTIDVLADASTLAARSQAFVTRGGHAASVQADARPVRADRDRGRPGPGTANSTHGNARRCPTSPRLLGADNPHVLEVELLARGIVHRIASALSESVASANHKAQVPLLAATEAPAVIWCLASDEPDTASSVALTLANHLIRAVRTRAGATAFPGEHPDPGHCAHAH